MSTQAAAIVFIALSALNIGLDLFVSPSPPSPHIERIEGAQ